MSAELSLSLAHWFERLDSSRKEHRFRLLFPKRAMFAGSVWNGPALNQYVTHQIMQKLCIPLLHLQHTHT